MPTPTTAIAITQLAIYIILLPLISYLLIKHGKRGLLGWLYLFLFSTLQLISAGLQISNPQSTTSAILSSVGLSPLLLGLAGILHEAHIYLSPAPTNSESAKYTWAFQLVLHLLTVAGVVIIAISTSNLTKDAGTSAYSTDLKLRKAGSLLLLLAFLAIAAHAAWILFKHRGSANQLAKRLLYSTLLALPLVLARLVYTVVYSFAKPGGETFRALSPVTASIAIRVVFILLLPLLAMVSLVVGGIVSRSLVRRLREVGAERFEEVGGSELQGFARK